MLQIQKRNWTKIKTYSLKYSCIVSVGMCILSLLVQMSGFYSICRLNGSLDIHGAHCTDTMYHKCLRDDLYLSIIHHWNRQLKLYWFPLRKYRVNWGHKFPPMSVLGLKVPQKWFIHKCDTSLESSAQALPEKIVLIRVPNYLPCQY